MKSRNMVLAAIVLGLASGAALAGYVQPQPVLIDLVNRTAIGDMLSARNADNDLDLIGCGVRTFDIGGGSSLSLGFCSAGDTFGAQISCTTENPALIDAIHAISDYSFITFRWDENFQCTAVGNSTQSFYLPNLKVKK